MCDINALRVTHHIKDICYRAVWLFGISLGIGTLFLLAQALDDTGNRYYVSGCFYVIIAVFINAVALCVLLIHARMYPEYGRILLMRAALLLANIPIAILYMYIVFEIL